jgi:hypothetical protein
MALIHFPNSTMPHNVDEESIFVPMSNVVQLIRELKVVEVIARGVTAEH